jgi:hypothetical protein
MEQYQVYGCIERDEGADDDKQHQAEDSQNKGRWMTICVNVHVALAVHVPRPDHKQYAR